MPAATDGLYDSRFEHDACGVGFVADLKGRAGHDVVSSALKVLCNLEHRGALGADPETGEWLEGYEKQRELLLECQKRDQCVVAQLGAFSDVFEVILGRVSASQFSATEVASYMGTVVDQIVETERFLDTLRPAMNELMGGVAAV